MRVTATASWPRSRRRPIIDRTCGSLPAVKISCRTAPSRRASSSTARAILVRCSIHPRYRRPRHRWKALRRAVMHPDPYPAERWLSLDLDSHGSAGVARGGALGYSPWAEPRSGATHPWAGRRVRPAEALDDRQQPHRGNSQGPRSETTSVLGDPKLPGGLSLRSNFAHLP